MARKVISERSLSSSLKPGRRFASGVLEGALLSLFSLFLFVLSGYFDGFIPLYKEHSNAAGSYQKEMVSLICESGAGESDGSGGLLSYNERAEAYLQDVAYTSLLKNGESPSKVIYAEAKELTSDNDLPYRYFASFKAGKSASFSGGIDAGLASYWNAFEGAEGYFDEGEGHPILLLEKAKDLNEYFKNSSYSPGSEIAAKLKDSYKKLCKTVVNDFQNHYLPYLDAYASFSSERDAIYLFKIAEAFLCHLLSCLVYSFLFTLFLKGRQTLGKRILKIHLIHRDGTLLEWWESLLRSLLIYVESLILPCLMPLLFYGSGASDLFVRSLLGPFSLLSISIFSLALIAFSYSGCFYLKGKASWSEFAFKGKSVDGRES